MDDIGYRIPSLPNARLRLSRSRWLWVFVCLLVCGLSPPVFAEFTHILSAKTNDADRQTADIEIFVRDGCPHCLNAEAFLEILKKEQPALNIIIHDISKEPQALEHLRYLANKQNISAIRVPAFIVGGELIFGYSDEANTGQLIRSVLAQKATQEQQIDVGSCEMNASVSCENTQDTSAQAIDFFGHRLALDEVGLPLFTLAMGLLDGFNPCSIWVLLLMISLLAPMNDRRRMFVIAGTFVAVEGLVYFIFMAAWLNLFLLIGLSRLSEIIISAVALLAGLINIKDFLYLGQGVSLSIPDAAKPGIYGRIRQILQAQNLIGAVVGAIVLAVLVQLVELLCTSGFPALYTRILTLKQLDIMGYYSYLLLYNLAYMFDDVIILSIGVITLSQRRLQEKEGRWLKLISGLVMVGIGVYLLLNAS